VCDRQETDAARQRAGPPGTVTGAVRLPVDNGDIHAHWIVADGPGAYLKACATSSQWLRSSCVSAAPDARPTLTSDRRTTSWPRAGDAGIGPRKGSRLTGVGSTRNRQ
jgi:hypothetical protein